MAEIITVEDLPESVRSAIDAALLTVMVDGLNARATRVAPCLKPENEPAAELLAEARLILIGAVKRWGEAGSGALSQMQAGSFGLSTDSRQRTGFNLWPSEIEQLQDLCASGAAGDAYMINMTGLSSEDNPLAGAVINAAPGQEPAGSWSDEVS